MVIFISLIDINSNKMKSSSKNNLIKLSFNVSILIFAILTILSGIFQVTWYLREFGYSEPFYIFWNYGMFSYPYNSPYGPFVNIILSIFFLTGVFMQLILYKDVDRSIYIYSLGLMVLGLFGCLIIPYFVYSLVTEEFYYYWDYQVSTQVLPGFYWGLLSIFIIIVKRYIINILPLRSCPYCRISLETLEIEEEKLAFKCPNCLKIFRDKPKKRIEKQDYMNLEWLRHQHYNLEKNIQEIADEQYVSMITIKKWVDKLENNQKRIKEK
ncbi:MAG: hypothetical protein ACFE9N_13625 [Promethearchaeota archaeon]